MVRLAFHDAAPYDLTSNTGGPNGCIDFNDPDNGGLQNVVQQMATLKSTLLSSYGINITLADLYQYAGVVATWCALPSLPQNFSSTVVQFPFLYGRTDAATCDYKLDVGHLPNSELAYGEVNNLALRWGMTMWQMTALMGAHSLGTTKTANSGARG
jgi:L-ascorbate peroxidase